MLVFLQVFLSRFEFVNELLFPVEPEKSDKQRLLARRKARKE
jgi:hypothetical protein